MTIKCKTNGLSLYHYDKENDVVCIFTKQRISLKRCPESIVEAFIHEDYDAEIIINEQKKDL